MSTEVMTDSNYLGVLFADSAILGTLIALQVKNQADQDKAIDAIKAVVNNALQNIYTDQAIPVELAARVKMRVDNVFEIAKNRKLG
jgi:hypothetical protein